MLDGVSKRQLSVFRRRPSVARPMQAQNNLLATATRPERGVSMAFHFGIPCGHQVATMRALVKPASSSRLSRFVMRPAPESRRESESCYWVFGGFDPIWLSKRLTFFLRLSAREGRARASLIFPMSEWRRRFWAALLLAGLSVLLLLLLCWSKLVLFNNVLCQTKCAGTVNPNMLLVRLRENHRRLPADEC